MLLSRLLSRSLVLGSSSWEVEATVYSHMAFPVSMNVRASGMKSILSASARALQPLWRMVSSWNRELNSMNWMPVIS